jgi:hypothetical protein
LNANREARTETCARLRAKRYGEVRRSLGDGGNGSDLQADLKVRLYLWVIGTLSSASLATMSSADVAGFTVFSM